MSEVKYHPGRFVWHEIFTPDVEKTTKFYTSLFGWNVQHMDMGEMKYPMIHNGETAIGGIADLEMIPKEGVPPHWLGYVSVPSVDEAAAAVKSNGGTVAMEPMDIPNVGRFAVFGDPAHAYSAAYKGSNGDGDLPERPPLGAFCWDQVNVENPDAVVTFYQKVYGWEKDTFEGAEDLWTFKAGEVPAASLMKAPAGTPAHWITYVVVENLDAAKKKATELGGKIFVERITVPGVGDIAVVADDVGAAIGLFEAPQG